MSTVSLMLGGETSGEGCEVDLHEDPRESWVRTHHKGKESQIVIRGMRL